MASQKDKWWITATHGGVRPIITVDAPTLTAINPPICKSEGLSGANIILTGTHLNTITKITIAGVDHTVASGNVTIQSAWQCTVVNLLAITAGTPTVTAVNPSGSGSLPTYALWAQSGIYFCHWAGVGVTLTPRFAASGQIQRATSITDVVSGNTSTAVMWPEGGPQYVASGINGQPALRNEAVNTSDLLDSGGKATTGMQYVNITAFTPTTWSFITTAKVLCSTLTAYARSLEFVGSPGFYLSTETLPTGGYDGLLFPDFIFFGVQGVSPSPAFNAYALGVFMPSNGQIYSRDNGTEVGPFSPTQNPPLSMGTTQIRIGANDRTASYDTAIKFDYSYAILIDHELSGTEKTNWTNWHNYTFGFNP